MRVAIAGYTGFRNLGDEGILQSMVDELGDEHEYIVYSSLPFNLIYGYHSQVMFTSDIRTFYDQRLDFDVLLLGGGNLNWGYGWQLVMLALANHKPVMNYAVGYDLDAYYSPVLANAYYEFLGLFDAITVRDIRSVDMLYNINVNSELTMCPSINLETEKIPCQENMIVVCPRYEDFSVGDNIGQIEWIVSRLKDEADNVLLIPFNVKDFEGSLRDLEVCINIQQRLKGSRIINQDGRMTPKEAKYVISRSKLVVSGGRYHALVYAASHNVPFEVYPQALINYSKTASFIEMHQHYGTEKLKSMEKRNVEVFKEVTEK